MSISGGVRSSTRAPRPAETVTRTSSCVARGREKEGRESRRDDDGEEAEREERVMEGKDSVRVKETLGKGSAAGVRIVERSSWMKMDEPFSER